MSARKRANKGRSSRNRVTANSSQVREAFAWFIQQGSFEELSIHRNTSWLPSDLIIQALLWVWSASPKLTDAFEDARIQSQQLIGKAALSTYQGLAGALQTWTPTFIPLLQVRIHELIDRLSGLERRRPSA